MLSSNELKTILIISTMADFSCIRLTCLVRSNINKPLYLTGICKLSYDHEKSDT